MSTRISAVLFVAACVALSGAAGQDNSSNANEPSPKEEITESAGAPPLGGRGFIGRADKDGDKKISRGEFDRAFPNAPDTRFSSLDTSGDELLSPEELRAPGSKVWDPKRMLRRADKDEDGKVTAEEFMAISPKGGKARFKRLDRNGDEVLSVQDFRQRPEAKRPATGKAGASSAGVLAEERQAATRVMIRTCDGDGNGKVSLKELRKAKPGFTSAAFDQLDANKDGVLSVEDCG